MKKRKLARTETNKPPLHRLTTGQKILLWVFLSLPMVAWTTYRHSPRGKRLSNEAPGRFKLESWMFAILGFVLAAIIGIFAERIREPVQGKISSPHKADSATKQTLYADDPLCIGNENLQKLVGKPIPYERWGKWGFPETLPGTLNLMWVAYLPKGNITFQSLKKTDIIQRINFGRGLNFNTKSNESCDPNAQKPVSPCNA